MRPYKAATTTPSPRRRNSGTGQLASHARPEFCRWRGLYQYVERDGNNLGSLYDKPENVTPAIISFLPSFSAKYQVDESKLGVLQRHPQHAYATQLCAVQQGRLRQPQVRVELNQELGWRYTEDDMALSATLFYISFKDRQVSTTDAAGDYMVLNVGSVANKGLELEWSGLLPHNFNYYASYTTPSPSRRTICSARMCCFRPRAT